MKEAKEKANEQSQRSAVQRRRERQAEESGAEAEATVKQIRRHHRLIGSLFSCGAATATAPAPPPKVWRGASSSIASGVRKTGASPGEVNKRLAR
jgi:hypothetical protein